MERSDSRSHSFGRVFVTALPAVGLLGCAALIIASGVGPTHWLDEPPPQPSLTDVAPRSVIVGAALHDLGLTPETLSAAGIEPLSIRMMVLAVSIDSDFGVDRYLAAAMDHKEAERAYERAKKRVQRGHGFEGEASSVEFKRQHAHNCEIQCRNAAARLTQFVNGLLTEEEQARLARIRANTKVGVELPYAAAELSELDRITLREALAERSWAERFGGELSQRHADFLSELESDFGVSAAMDAMPVGIPIAQQAFDEALRALDN